MSEKPIFQGSLFAAGFLDESIAEMPEWQALDNGKIEKIEEGIRDILAGFPVDHPANESQTEDDLIWPVLGSLGWTEHLGQQNLSSHGRDDVPDGLLFADKAAKERANRFPEEWKRYQHGLAIVESKRWLRPLDRRSGRRGEETAPSTQMLRYLRRVDLMTTGKLRWGVLTNGAQWRLYHAGARSVSEEFFEIDLTAVLGLPGRDDELPELSTEARRHWLKVFMLVFGRESFLPDAVDSRTFHQRAIVEGRFYREELTTNLAELVFEQTFPDIARAIAEADSSAPMEEVRDAALILLYRLLFILYAEDRNLLPVRDARYDDYSLREKVRGEIGRRKDANDTFSETAARYWSTIDDLCRAIDRGDPSIGLPPYNGGLFDRDRTPLLNRIRLGDAVMSEVIDALSFQQTPSGRHYINYRDLGVQHLGSVYERLLEQEIVREDDRIVIRPNIFARKDSGSYYTPDDLVSLIITETLDPLVQVRLEAFDSEMSRLIDSPLTEDRRMGRLKLLDPAEKILELKVCDPAMGSGHFLVSLVDYLTDKVVTAMAEAEASWEGYISPLSERIDGIRNTIIANAEEKGWAVDPAQLDDRHIVRRMVLKRCVYGVDKNPMAVELAKVSLWLHTFTVGAPLSFLDHHLRCGDSLFGAWVSGVAERAKRQVSWAGPVARAMRSASPMQIIEGLTDAEIAEAHRSADVFDEVSAMTVPLNDFLSILHAFEWLDIRDKDDRTAYTIYLDGGFGNPVEIAQGKSRLDETKYADRFLPLLESAQNLVEEQRFLNWQVAFPGVWTEWEEPGLTGGFDAVIGNPPWDRMKLQQVEWFAARQPEIALATRAADRKRMIAELEQAGDPLARDFSLANERAAAALRIARKGGDYPLLSGGDVNLYSLFVERAMTLVKPDGMVGLLVPSGIASDKTSAPFFKSVATEGRLKALYDFENRRTRYDSPPYFPDVDSRFKFCVFVASRSPVPKDAQCAFFLHDVSELKDPDRCFSLSAEDFARVNPNTGTAPIFRSRRDAVLTTQIYSRLPVLVDRSSGEPVKAWPVKYSTMFHMTNDSHLFRTWTELEEKEGAWPIGGNRFDSPSGEWVPLYVGRMIHQFDHRAASVKVNEKNLHNPALSGDITIEQKADPCFLPTPQYWVPSKEISFPDGVNWTIAFRDIARTTDARTFIGTVVPKVGLGNTAPAIFLEGRKICQSDFVLLSANFSALVLDYVVRQKTHSTHLNWYIVEQFPIIPHARYKEMIFGLKTAEEIVRDSALELIYSADDMAPFARDMGYVDDGGNVMPPFQWDEERRINLRAKLDAVYFHLYGVTDRDDIRYIYSTFPIVEREEYKTWGKYHSLELCLAWVNALSAGDSDAEIHL